MSQAIFNLIKEVCSIPFTNFELSIKKITKKYLITFFLLWTSRNNKYLRKTTKPSLEIVTLFSELTPPMMICQILK